MNLFPSLSDLAGATEREVLAAWQGLGYYSRARRLHAAAKSIMERHNGKIPTDERSLLALPGIGHYTAAAIMAFAHDQHALVLDTNIIRVFARLENLPHFVDTRNGVKSLQQIAEAFYPSTGCRRIASALMDLGSTLCISGEPDCEKCPLQKNCLAVSPQALPRKKARPVISKTSEQRLWDCHEDRLFLELSNGPRWKALWILPELGTIQPHGRPLAEIVYPITRYRVTMKVYRTMQKPHGHLQGFTVAELSSIPIPTPHRKAIEKVRQAIAARKDSSHTSTDVQHEN
jgi:A/G-specific adenine glycosylase